MKVGGKLDQQLDQTSFYQVERATVLALSLKHDYVQDTV